MGLQNPLDGSFHHSKGVLWRRGRCIIHKESSIFILGVCGRQRLQTFRDPPGSRPPPAARRPHTRPGQARPGQARPSQARPSQARPSQARPGRFFLKEAFNNRVPDVRASKKDRSVSLCRPPHTDSESMPSVRAQAIVQETCTWALAWNLSLGYG